MDNILDRIGLYDFFGVMIPGMWFGLMLYFIRFPLIDKCIFPSETTIKVVIFLLLSYVVGTLIQEISSWKFKSLREIPKNTFLDTNSDIFKAEELNEVKKFANIKLGKNVGNHKFLEDDNEKLFFQAKIFLENSSKMEKANKLDAIFAMSRDFIVVNFGVIIGIVITYMTYKKFTDLQIWIGVYSILSSFVFYARAKRYAKMRVRTIIRQYISVEAVKEFGNGEK